MKNYLQLIRVEQYVKNLFVFAPLFFSGAFLEREKTIIVIFTFLCFCITASSIYILNDYFDVRQDKLHPEKSKRPLASGKITTKKAFLLMFILMFISLGSSYLISLELFKVILFYIIMNILYSKWFKHIAILDINIIALGFVLRLFAGAAVSNVIPSVWILLITYLLALFLAIAKRRTDVVLAQNGQQVRKNIEGYNLIFIDITLGILASVLIVCYIFYCIAPENQIHYKSKLLYVSIILVMNGIFRYLKLSLVDQSTYSPTKIVLNDTFIQFTILSWSLLMGYLLYFNH
ncbi:decaprenyl-phosphate phosphoribosyltransferase [Flavobacterium sp. LM4]|uniref:decaprenyl-phosphate phosphoribosyltransferase n=1 Tax=Flavobacterium sp. LM4 TaxID=1938609 RepID=UPI0009920FD9|nr:decaprenyl-phosphate phosphoribosyltransferase [Flavobacterium sp. LM4]OOV13053.1 decaprenyl-phosphate phosphoribosyltransferase [Flavobacterium sp. LM4]